MMSRNNKRMMAWVGGLGSLVAVCALLAGCPGTGVGTTTPNDQTPADQGGASMMGDAAGMDVSQMASALFVRITQTEPFQEWAQFPDFQGTQVSRPPHGPMSRVFINPPVETALTDFKGMLPADSIIVKQNIGESEAVTEAVLTVMWKVPGFDPENNDWFWVNVSMDGEFRVKGMVDTCRNCHGGLAGDNDFVFVHQF